MDRLAGAAAFLPAAQEALKAFPISPGAIVPVSLSENVTFRVTDANDGAAYVLRLHRPWYHTLDELDAERVWVRALSESGMAVPTPVAACDGREYVAVHIPGTGERRQAGMMRWSEGEILAKALARGVDAATTGNFFRQLGAIAGDLHNQSSAWAVPANFTRHALDAGGLMGDAPFWGPFWDHAALSAAERRLLLDTRDGVRPILDRLGTDPSIYSLIHADMHPGNVLVDGTRLTVIDFDDSGFGWHLYDLAVALVHNQLQPGFEGIERALIEGYRTRRPLSDQAVAMLPMFRMIRGMVQIGWYHQRPEIDASRFFGEMKDVVCAQCEAFARALRSGATATAAAVR